VKERTSVRPFKRGSSWGWFAKGELVPPSSGRWRVQGWDHGWRKRLGVGNNRRRLWSRRTADTAFKSEEGADLCTEARFLALATVGVRQIENERR